MVLNVNNENMFFDKRQGNHVDYYHIKPVNVSSMTCDRKKQFQIIEI